MRTVGIIGGLGPETSATFYLELIEKNLAHKTAQRPPILLWNVPIPFAIEDELILHGTGEERYLPFLQDAAMKLERGGADFLVIPCNTVHVFIEEIRRSVSIPVISIVEETVQTIKTMGLKRIGFLSTELTIKKRIYETIFRKQKIDTICPTDKDQQKMNAIIHAILSRNNGEKEDAMTGHIITSLKKQDIEALILACTDLQHIVSKTEGTIILDTMDILATATIREILS